MTQPAHSANVCVGSSVLACHVAWRWFTALSSHRLDPIQSFRGVDV
jgi:hypothetical protein